MRWYRSKSTKDRVIAIASFPNPFPGNPYLDLLYGHLAAQGIRNVPSGYLGQEWLRAHRSDVDVLHFHWVSGYFERQGRVSLSHLLVFLAKLQLARLLGFQLVWTMHNLFPHDHPRGFKTWLARFLFLQSMDAIFVTFPSAVTDLRRLFSRRRGVYVIPHGNYRPIYPKVPKSGEARRQLGLDLNGFLFLLFGGIRPYKGAEAAIAAMQHCGLPGASLVVLGQCLDRDYELRLQDLARGDPRVRLILGRDDVPDAQVCLWMSAVDCLVAPYEHVYTSGTLYLAATFGKPVIAPSVGVFAGLHEPFLFLYRRDKVSAELPRLMREVAEADPEGLKQAADAFADRHDWSVIASQLALRLREIVS